MCHATGSARSEEVGEVAQHGRERRAGTHGGDSPGGPGLAQQVRHRPSSVGFQADDERSEGSWVDHRFSFTSGVSLATGWTAAPATSNIDRSAIHPPSV
jgi:hypothetical protein